MIACVYGGGGGGGGGATGPVYIAALINRVPIVLSTMNNQSTSCYQPL